jgi:F420-dependent oxidoreductase-like protein
MRLRVSVEPQQGLLFDQVAELARTAERLGFEGFFVSDHYRRIEFDDGAHHQARPLDAWMTLTGLAYETEKIRLGTLVSPITFRLPGPLTVVAAQLDSLSGGRVEVGLGAGWYQEEHEAFGIPFPDRGDRLAMLHEYVEVLDRLWRSDESTVAYEGRFYRLSGEAAPPRLGHDARIPLIIGGSARSVTGRIAAQFADELNVQFKTPSEAQIERRLLSQVCHEVGRDETTLAFSVLVGATGTEATADAAEFRRVRDLGAALIGSPEEILEQVDQYQQVGVTGIYVSMLASQGSELLQMLADAVTLLPLAPATSTSAD